MELDPVLAALIPNLDDPRTRDVAIEQLRAILEPGDPTDLMTQCVALIEQLKTPDGRNHGISLIGPYVSSSSDVLRLALTFSRDDPGGTRVTAAGILAMAAAEPQSRQRLIELMSDSEPEVKNVAMRAAAKLRQHDAEERTGNALFVIPDRESRDAAMETVGRLEAAVKTLQDLGLDEAQNAIVDKALLPGLSELRSLLGSQNSDRDAVLVARRQGVLSVGNVVGTARSLAVAAPIVAASIGAVGNVDEAAENVAMSAEAMFKVGQVIAEILTRAL